MRRLRRINLTDRIQLKELTVIQLGDNRWYVSIQDDFSTKEKAEQLKTQLLQDVEKAKKYDEMMKK